MKEEIVRKTKTRQEENETSWKCRYSTRSIFVSFEIRWGVRYGKRRI